MFETCNVTEEQGPKKVVHLVTLISLLVFLKRQQLYNSLGTQEGGSSSLYTHRAGEAGEAIVIRISGQGEVGVASCLLLEGVLTAFYASPAAAALQAGKEGRIWFDVALRLTETRGTLSSYSLCYAVALLPGDPSVLRFLIAAREEVNSTQLRDDLLSMLVAGHETTASALTWTLYLLVQNPDKLAKAQVKPWVAGGLLGWVARVWVVAI